jgi:hypothetical protein
MIVPGPMKITRSHSRPRVMFRMSVVISVFRCPVRFFVVSFFAVRGSLDDDDGVTATHETCGVDEATEEYTWFSGGSLRRLLAIDTSSQCNVRHGRSS